MLKTERTTRVLPIVGLDVGAIGCISLLALVQGEGTLLNFRINLSSLNNNELQLPGRRFSTPPPSAILVRCLQAFINTYIPFGQLH